MLRGHRRAALGALATWASASALGAVGACSTSSSDSPFGVTTEAGPDTSTTLDFDTGAVIITGEDQASPSYEDATPATCPGSALPATSTAQCVIDTTESCSSCAPWGFACPTFAAPQFQANGDAGASTPPSCTATPTDAGGALVCCVQPICIVSAASGACDASTATRYECNGSALPTGACSWLGPSAPNDYCCE